LLRFHFGLLGLVEVLGRLGRLFEPAQDFLLPGALVGSEIVVRAATDNGDGDQRGNDRYHGHFRARCLLQLFLQVRFALGRLSVALGPLFRILLRFRLGFCARLGIRLAPRLVLQLALRPRFGLCLGADLGFLLRFLLDVAPRLGLRLGLRPSLGLPLLVFGFLPGEFGLRLLLGFLYRRLPGLFLGRCTRLSFSFAPRHVGFAFCIGFRPCLGLRSPLGFLLGFALCVLGFFLRQLGFELGFFLGKLLLDLGLALGCFLGLLLFLVRDRLGLGAGFLGRDAAQLGDLALGERRVDAGWKLLHVEVEVVRIVAVLDRAPELELDFLAA